MDEEDGPCEVSVRMPQASDLRLGFVPNLPRATLRRYHRAPPTLSF